MPAISKGDKVLVTGATGFIGIWVAQTFLEHGYAVRGTARSQEKGQHLIKLFKPFGDRFELALVPDMAADGAFDEAVKNVNAVAHTASPVYMDADDPKEIIDPAVKGTTSVLHSILKHGTGIKRVVVTSSAVSVVDITKGRDNVFTEEDWSDETVAIVKKDGAAANGFFKYVASKNLAEKAAWKLFEEKKDTVSWDLSVVNPVYVFGPIRHEVKSIKALNQSSMLWYRHVLDKDTTTSIEELRTQGGTYVDVRDLAEAHVLSLEKAAAGKERFIISARPFVWQEFLDAANALPSSLIAGRTIAKGDPGSGGKGTPLQLSSEKATRILELTYRTIEDTTRDTIAEFQERGW